MNNKILAKALAVRGKMYGTTTMGERGQVVIPAQARKDLNLKPGDQLLVMARFGKVLGLVKANELQGFINKIMEHVEEGEARAKAKKHLQELFKGSKIKI
jgi:AbrB family looped-hinge helix DNA binding protein